MGTYLKEFNNHAEYEAYKNSGMILPNVSNCLLEEHVHYNPYVEPPLPNNIITYKASNKLNEYDGWGNYGGLHINGFNTEIVSHTFEDGVGTIKFKEDVTNIGASAFYACSCTEIILPSTITSIGARAFSYWTNAFAMTIYALQPPTLGNDVFEYSRI